jgi:hypothetical protein
MTSSCKTQAREEARLAAKRDAGAGGTRRNKSGSSYNILTLDYEPSPAGRALQYQVGRSTR